jgi:hypothetical protein
MELKNTQGSGKAGLLRAENEQVTGEEGRRKKGWRRALLWMVIREENT